MTFKRFDRLNIPHKWKDYFSEYPNGLTLIEAMIQWVSQVNDMVDLQNSLTTTVEDYRVELDDFISKFSGELQETVTDTLNDWQQTGFLDVVISEAIEWELDNFKTETTQNFEEVTTQLAQIVTQVSSYGAIGDGQTDDTNAIRNAYDSIKNTGGVLLFEANKTYLVDGTIINHDTGSLVKVVGHNTVIKQKPRDTSYSTIYYDGNIEFEGLILEGYIGQGTGWATATPGSSFGFRSRPTMTGRAVFRNCTVRDYPTDGWYHNAEFGQVHLYNCVGYDCYRNAFAAVGGDEILIDGGKWAYNTKPFVIESVAGIDIEPNENRRVNRVELKNLTNSGTIDVISNTGGSRISKVILDNIIFTSEVVNLEHGLKLSRCDLVKYGDIQYKGESKYRRANLIENAQSRGRIDYEQMMPLSPNLIETPYNTTEGWTSSSNAGTLTTGVPIGMWKGARIETVSSNGYRSLKKVIPVEPNAWYTLGALIQMKNSTGGAKHGLYVVVAGKHYTLQAQNDEPATWVNGSIQIPNGVSEVEIRIGTETTQDIDIVFAFPFFAKGVFGIDNVPKPIN